MNYIVRFQSETERTAQTVSVPSGTLLVTAAEQAGLTLRTACGGGGTCGKCQIFVNGQKRLACQTTVECDLDVVVPTLSLRNEISAVVQTNSFLGGIKAAGRTGHRYGVAVDIGTTTLAAELHALHEPNTVLTVSRANPQRNFGDDVITRIQKVIEEPAFLAKLQTLIVGAVNDMLEELAAKAGISITDISLLTVAGNTVMEHLFLGIDPSPLGFTPFEAPVSQYPTCLGSDIGVKMAPEGIIETLPIFGSFVGGDIVAGVLATEIHQKSRECSKQLKSRRCSAVESPGSPQFLIDIGTNGELVLSYNGELYTSATAAGPAFEGGRIEHGTLAVPGAIDKIELKTTAGSVNDRFGDQHVLNPSLTVGTIVDVIVSTIADRPPIGICGSGLIDAVSELLRHGLIKPSGQFNVKSDSPFLRYWKMIDGKPNFELASAEISGIGESILLTQRDVRQLQLATGAIRAGIRLLLQQQGLRPEDIGTFYVAGGFGSFIRPEAAQRIGLIPKEIPLERIRFCGNTSLAGARLTLLDPRYQDEAQTLFRRAHPIELAAQPDFADIYADSMIFS